VPLPACVREQKSVGGLPHLVGDMQGGGFGEVVAHPPGPLHLPLRPVLKSLAIQSESSANSVRTPGAFAHRGEIGAARATGVTLQPTAQPEHRIPMLLDPAAHYRITA
jgi:hypothetical protein